MGLKGQAAPAARRLSVAKRSQQQKTTLWLPHSRQLLFEIASTFWSVALGVAVAVAAFLVAYVLAILAFTDPARSDLSHSENASVFCGSFCVSAPCYGRAEDVGVMPVVVAKLEFRDVQ